MLKKMGWVNCGIVAAWMLSGCASDQTTETNSQSVGTIALPLTTYGSSGVRYQLRNARFEITPQSSYWGTGGYWSTTRPATAGVAAVTTGGYGAGSSTAPGSIIVNSDSDPEAPSIEVELEEKAYQIHLLPGWSLDRLEGTVATPVEAQLLSGEWQWVYVSPHSTSWVTYQFGIGDRAVWFNGKLNVEVQVYEDPEEYYGPSYGGAGGFGGTTTFPPAVGGAVTTTTRVPAAGGWTGIE